MTNLDSQTKELERLIETLESIRNSISIVGRPLTPEEEQIVRTIQNALPGLKESLRLLSATQSPEPQPDSIEDGRYEGGTPEYFFELRIDGGVSGVISADIFRANGLENIYLASIRTIPGDPVVSEDAIFEIVGQDEEGGRSLGTLSLISNDSEETEVGVELVLDSALKSLPVRAPVSFFARKVSERMRVLGLEIETEEDVDSYQPFDFNGANMTIESSLNNAGFDVTDIGSKSQVPKNPLGWGTAQLHALMSDLAQASLTERAWELHLLWLSNPTRKDNGLLGIMFDSTPELPRQGTAVFADEVREFVPVDTDRKMIQTAVHELGHALNLAHRFERALGHADSTSFMNYDWHYKGGNHRNEFWNDFEFTFDPDELEFLRHAPLPKLIPGGAAFHSVPYWKDGSGSYRPYRPELPLPGYRLSLTPPGSGTVFEFGQPVFFEALLENINGQTFDLPQSILDPKAGFLELRIKRIGNPHVEVFHPVMQRCLIESPRNKIFVSQGVRLRNNVNITFGSGGFSFPEPGRYEIQGIVSLFTENNNLVVKSNLVQIRVASPKSMEEERDAEVLLRDDVGMYFALGGSDVFEKANNDLEEILNRRTSPKGRVSDPISANILRCQGINQGRPYTRYIKGEWKQKEGNSKKASTCLNRLGKEALLFFDSHTAEHTQKLCKKHADRSK